MTATTTNIKTPAELVKALEALGQHFCLDTETAMAPKCFEPGQIRLLQFHSDAAEFWLDALEMGPEHWDVLQRHLGRSDLHIYAQNAGFDYRVLMANGVVLGGQLYDTMIASQLLHNGRANTSHSLAEIVRRELGRKLDKTLQTSNWMEAELSPEQLAYALEDVRVTWECAHVLHEQIAARGFDHVYRLECALIPVVVSMEHHGMPIDTSAISDTIEHYAEESEAARACFLETLDGRLEDAGAPRLPREEDGTFNLRPKATGSVRLGTKKQAGFNINSQPQVLAWWRYLGIEPVDDAKKPSLDRKVLARFQSDELVRMFLNYKRVEKRLGMAQKLVEHTDADGRIRARFMPLATGTGRFSSSSPNLQQVPRDPEFRCCFRPPAGRVLVQADYSAMELRVAAAIANEPQMLKAFGAGADIHTRTAALMFGVPESEVTKAQRQQAKALNFGALYGSSARGVQQYCATLGMFLSERQAGELLELWHDAYPAFAVWHRECNARAQRGEPVTTLIGRRRLLYGQDNRLTTQANNVVQGTSADIMKAALVAIHQQLPEGAWVIACVHDEVIVECDQEQGSDVLEIVLREMEEAATPILGDKVRIAAEGGVLATWGDK